MSRYRRMRRAGRLERILPLHGFAEPSAHYLGGILTESFGRYWTLGMAAFSLAAAILAFWGPRLRLSQLATLRKPGVTGAFVYGSAAPLLVLLTVAASQAGTAYGVLLSFAFGVGRGLPFLLVGVFAGAVMRQPPALALNSRPAQG